MHATMTTTRRRRWWSRGYASSATAGAALAVLTACVVPTAPFALGSQATLPPTAAAKAAASGRAAALHASVPGGSTAVALPAGRTVHPTSRGPEGGLASRLLFTYAAPLLNLAAKRRLEPGDAPRAPEGRAMRHAVARLAGLHRAGRDEAAERAAQRGGTASSGARVLGAALLRSQQRTLLRTGVLRLLNTAVQAFPALLVARLLRQIEAGGAVPRALPLRTAALLVTVLSAKMVVENQYFHGVVGCATQVRGSVAGLVFDKALRLPAGAGEGAGSILNLVQSDAAALEALTLQLHTVWDGLLQICIYVTLLHRLLGRPVLYGVGVLLATIPLNAVTLRILNRLNQAELAAKDRRMGKTTESVAGMLLLKLLSWEDLFAADVRDRREEELRLHRRRGAVRALNQAIGNAVPTVTLVVTLAAYAKTGRPVVASTVFTAISLFNQLRYPLFFYPMLIDGLANGRNALRRIATYLGREEIAPYVARLPPWEASDGGRAGGSIEMQCGNFVWQGVPTTSGPDKNSKQNNNKKQAKVAVAEDEEGPSVLPALCDASLSVGPGEVVAVVGEVGSGKTALVKALIGELAPVPRSAIVDCSQTAAHGDLQAAQAKACGAKMPRVTAHGSIAYCAQEAWLPKGTIRESVVFGREYDEAKYLRAIYAAGLDGDISEQGHALGKWQPQGLLSHETDVGEGGSNLSGGQRARVALARALYDEDAGVYVLDDPLSALDAAVGATVFERVTTTLRRRGAAVVLVTNDPNLPRRCDGVLLMGSSATLGARIVDTGTYDELIERGHDLRTIARDGNRWAHSEANADGEEEEEREGHREAALRAQHVTPAKHLSSSSVAENATVSSDCHADPDCEKELTQDPSLLAEHIVPQSMEPAVDDSDTIASSPSSTQQGKMLSADDAMSTEAVPRSTYLAYFRSVKSPLLIGAALASYLVSNGSQFFQQLVIARWTEAGSQGTGAIAAAVSAKYLNRLVGAAAMVSVSMYFRSYLTMRVGASASKTLHSDMLGSVFRAPLSFFSSTPSGQLLTRFGRELETVDRSLPDGISSVLFCFLQIFFSTLALAGVVTPLMVVPLGLVSVLYIKTMGRFRPAARDLKRCESKSRSPIYTQFREALRGAETIRSVPGGQALWSRRHQDLTDENISVYNSVKVLDRWLSVRLESLGNVVVLTAAIASVFLSRAGRLKSGSAGWGLTQALSITGLLTWAVRVLTELETQFMSVMRVLEVTGMENPKIKEVKSDFNSTQSDAALLESGWPWAGNIEYKDVSMRYNSASPLALENVTVSIPAGTTLGVVGRTGSGKSSLLLTLFRIVEVEGGGSITIDGVDIRSLSLQGLRDSLSIIPQSPTLFAGTLLYNLDASGRASREDAWNALEKASPEIARQFLESELGLDTQISEGGDNLSLGQRQLICLARALLKGSKVLVLDEATSSVDTKTDAQVQETIRREFVEKGVTVITVAHRLDTVLGYDNILVLDSGKPVELGAPGDLLRRPGYLRRLFDADQQSRQKGQMFVKSR